MRFGRTGSEGDGTGRLIAAGCLAAIFRAVFFLEAAGLAFLRGMRISPLRSRLRIKAEVEERALVACRIMILQETLEEEGDFLRETTGTRERTAACDGWSRNERRHFRKFSGVSL